MPLGFRGLRLVTCLKVLIIPSWSLFYLSQAVDISQPKATLLSAYNNWSSSILYLKIQYLRAFPTLDSHKGGYDFYPTKYVHCPALRLYFDVDFCSIRH